MFYEFKLKICRNCIHWRGRDRPIINSGCDKLGKPMLSDWTCIDRDDGGFFEYPPDGHKRTIRYYIIKVDEKEHDLKNQIEMKVSFIHKRWVFENDILGIVAHDRDYQEAMDDFFEDFHFLYLRYYLGDSSKMIGNALKIKSNLQYLIDDISK